MALKEAKDDILIMDDINFSLKGTQKKANLTGAVDAISSKEIEDRPVSNLGRALQGAVPNLNITYGSGKPNEGTNINIRGFGSINQDAKPCQIINILSVIK